MSDFRYTPVLRENNKKVAFATLGCKLNYSESSSLSRQFIENGYILVDENTFADIYIINTCSVTEQADKKCRNIIRKLHKSNPEAVIAVIGCYAQLKPEEIKAIKGVNIILGADKKGDIYKVISAYISSIKPEASENDAFQSDYSSEFCEIKKVDNIFSAYSSGERTRSFLKVQDGCDYHCSYFTIPLARGNSRNLSISKLTQQAEEIASKDIKEIVLTGVNTGDFGKTTKEDFLDLLKALNKVKGIERYRISSIEPNLLREDIIDWIVSGTKFLPHFHIPLQSGSNKILALMRRRYSIELFTSKIEMIRSKMDRGEGNLKVFFGIDLIVGFPGETDEEFEETYNLLRDIIKPAFIHVFPYSRRANTTAAQMSSQVPDHIKKERVERLSRLCDKLYSDFCDLNKGLETKILYESVSKKGKMIGYSENYIRVERSFEEDMVGKIRNDII